MRFNFQSGILRMGYLERCDGDMGDVCIELLLGTLIVVTFSYNHTRPSSICEIQNTKAYPRTLELHPQTMGNSLDSLSPDSLVKFGVQSHVSGSHRFLGKVDHGFDGPGSSLFE
jgi:hypothetical protein